MYLRDREVAVRTQESVGAVKIASRPATAYRRLGTRTPLTRTGEHSSPATLEEPAERLESAASAARAARARSLRFGVRAIVEFAGAGAASWIGYAVDGGSSTAPFAIALPIVWTALVIVGRTFDLSDGASLGRHLAAPARVSVKVLVALALLSFVAGEPVPRAFAVVALPLAFAFSVVSRVLAHRRGGPVEGVVLVGTPGSVVGLAAALSGRSRGGVTVVGACVPDFELDADTRHSLAGAGVPVLGDLASLPAVVREFGPRFVAVSPAGLEARTLRSIAWSLESTSAELVLDSGLRGIADHRVRARTVADVPLLGVELPRYEGGRHRLKGLLDRCAAAAALVILSPLLLVLAALVRITSRGPAFYKQERIGRGGVPFRMIKFRSMYTDSETRLQLLRGSNDSDGLLFKMRADPRVTPMGTWLRRFSLDELPQLLNVLTGSMSLVGPRPPLPCEVAQYDDEVRRRLLVKPGLTGLWQVSGRSDLSWSESVRLDLHYVENWSLRLDLLLLAKTARAVVKATGAY